MKLTPQNRRLRQGALATAVTVVFLAVVILLNLIAGQATQRYGLRADLTGDRVFSLSDGTVRFLQNLEQEVDIYILGTEQAYTAQGSYFIQAAEVLKQYGLHSDRVTVTFLDLMRNPGFTTRYPDLDLHSNYVLLTAGDEARLLDPESFFNLYADDFGMYIASSRVEQTVTSVISGMVSDQETYAYVLTGHNESPAAGLSDALVRNNYTVSTLPLVSRDIPEHTDLLILSAPQMDYTREELEKLDAYLYNGGNYGKTLFYLAAVDQPALPALDAFLAGWGIGIGSGIVFETDYDALGGNSWFLTIADYAEEHYAQSAGQTAYRIYMPNSRPLENRGGSVSGSSVTTLLAFSDFSGVRAIDSSLTGWSPSHQEITGPIPALLLSQRSGKEGVSSVLAASTSLAVEAGVLADATYANSTYYLNLLAGLTGRDDLVIIESKQLGNGVLGISYGQALVWGVIFFIALPTGVLAAGGIVFFRRRHL